MDFAPDTQKAPVKRRWLLWLIIVPLAIVAGVVLAHILPSPASRTWEETFNEKIASSDTVDTTNGSAPSTLTFDFTSTEASSYYIGTVCWGRGSTNGQAVDTRLTQPSWNDFRAAMNKRGPRNIGLVIDDAGSQGEPLKAITITVYMNSGTAPTVAESHALETIELLRQFSPCVQR